MNTFCKLKNKITSNFFLHPEFNKKIIKIQSLWRSTYLRKKIKIYWKLFDFKDILKKIIKNYQKYYFIDFLNKLNSNRNLKNKIKFDNTSKVLKSKKKFKIINHFSPDKIISNNNKGKEYNNDKKDNNLEKNKKPLKKIENDYVNLLKNYNLLSERCKELEQVINKNNAIFNKNVMKDLDSDNEKSNVQTNKISSKRFDIIEPEEKDKFKIIQINNKIQIINSENNNKIFRVQKNKKFYSIAKQVTIQYEYSQPNKEINIIEKPQSIQYVYSKPIEELNIIENQVAFLYKNKIRKKELQIIEKQQAFLYESKIPKKQLQIIEKQKSIQYNYDKSKIYQEYFQYYASNLYMGNINQFFIKETYINKKKSLFEIASNELSLINNKKNIKNRKKICKTESFYLISNKIRIFSLKKISLEKTANLDIINQIKNDNKEKALLYKIINNYSINLNKNVIKQKMFDNLLLNKENIIKLEIKELKKVNQKLFDNLLLNKENIIKLEIKELKKVNQKLFDNLLLNKENIIKLEINELKNIKNNKIELISENQINSNIEIKGIQKEKKFNNCLIDETKNYISIINKKDIKELNKKLIVINRDRIIISNNDNNNNYKNNLYKENIIEIILPKENEIDKKLEKKNIKSFINCRNERFNLYGDNNTNYKKEKIDFVEEKILNIIIEKHKDNNNKKDIQLIITNNDNLFIQKIKKNTRDKITEITEELNRIEPHNHYELILKGIVNLNEYLPKKNIIKNIFKENYNNMNNINNNKMEESAIKINYNINNEIDKVEGLEINPYELKRTKNNANNIFISYENRLEVLYNTNYIFTEKAKKNMMKIILPIRLKITLRGFIRKNILALLINRLKKPFDSHLNKIEKITEKDIKNILENYVIYKWNRSIYDLSKVLINNKSIFLEKIKK